VQLLGGGHVQVEQARERQIDRPHLVEVDAIVDATQRFEVGLAHRQRGRGAQRRPLLAVEGEVPAGSTAVVPGRHGAKPYADGVSDPQRARTRKQLGAWYTPPGLVAAVVREAVFAGARSALDPACGDGRFLHATGLREQLGVDIDPVAAAAGGFVCDDALQRDWGAARFDVVVGNPPFLNQLSRLTTRGGRSRFGGGPYADAAGEFLALAMRLARPGGRVGLVLPQSLLAARDAAPIRAAVDGAAALRWMWWSPTQMFDASVRVWAGVWEVGGAPGPVRRAFGPSFAEMPAMAMPTAWSGLIAGTAVAAHDGRCSATSPASSSTSATSTTASSAVGDHVDGPPLVTSGLIEPGECVWGRRPVRFAKERYAAPRVALARLSPVMQRWAGERLVPKILVANQTRVIEAVHDVRGEWLPGVPVITCFTDQPERVLAVLASPPRRVGAPSRRRQRPPADTVRLSPASSRPSPPLDPRPEEGGGGASGGG
jgi:hypothetical protein